MEADNLDTRWVEKVHPLTRAVEPEDPLELMAEPISGDPAAMLDGLLQEFAWLGYSEEELLGLFHNPGYPLLCELRVHFGDDEVRRQVTELVAQWGTLRFHETIVEEDPEELIQVVQISPLRSPEQPA